MVEPSQPETNPSIQALTERGHGVAPHFLPDQFPRNPIELKRRLPLKRPLRNPLGLITCLVHWLVAVSAAEFETRESSAGLEIFEKSIRPALIEHCFECHSAQAKSLKGGLRLDARDLLLAGGDSGPLFDAGDPDSSLLLSALRQETLEMPPRGKLPDATIDAFQEWIELGAPTPASFQASEASVSMPSSAERHWAFRPILRVNPPRAESGHWARNPIDLFILHAMKGKGLSPSAPAKPATLIRRLSFDTIGLPPSEPQFEATRIAPHPAWYEGQIEGFLAAPQFGEHWGRKWLDLARYADTNGVDENYNFLNAWRYRDYVVRAFNRDKPFDQFLIEQIAGDLLPKIEDSHRQADQIIATGFLTLGPKMLAEQDKDKLLMDIVDEQIDVLCKTAIGMTIGCARCHDHKFDPISSEDYYAMAGIFASTRTMANTNHVSFWTETVLPNPRNLTLIKRHEASLSERETAIDQLKREPSSEENKEKIRSQEKELKALRDRGPDLPKAMAVVDGIPRDLAIHIRGNHLNQGATPIPRGVPSQISPPLPGALPARSSGRLELARWFTDDDNPLTARVMVNRIWQGYFGKGLVSTPSNFGTRGGEPSHPGLLDWLAMELVDSDWSLKHIHRLILSSSTYRQASQPRPEMARIDPDNRYYWKQNRRRLSAEGIRDSILQVCRQLDLRMEGRVDHANRNETYYRGNGEEFQSPRRSIYLPVIRGRGYDLFNTFDYSESGAHLAQRTVTTVPHQALFMLNAPLVIDAAEAMAAQLDPGSGDLTPLYRGILFRNPSPDERRLAAALQRQVKSFTEPDSKRSPVGVLIQSLIASNEFVYVD